MLWGTDRRETVGAEASVKAVPMTRWRWEGWWLRQGWLKRKCTDKAFRHSELGGGGMRKEEESGRALRFEWARQ